MATLIRDRKVFDTAVEADAYASRYIREMWGYDGMAKVVESDGVIAKPGQWVVYTSCYDSCD